MLFENFLKSQEAEQAVAQDRANLAAERGFGESVPQLDLGDFSYGEMAGGGIAKLAGVDDGPPPVSGPNPQGLSYLMKRDKNT